MGSFLASAFFSGTTSGATGFSFTGFSSSTLVAEGDFSPRKARDRKIALRTDSDKCERSSETAVAFLGLAGAVTPTLLDAAAFLSAVSGASGVADFFGFAEAGSAGLG